MNSWNDVIKYIEDQLKPGVRNGTSVQKILNSLKAIINQINTGSIDPENSSLWDPAVIYPKDTQPVFWRDQWLVSNIEGNQGTEPINEAGQLHGSWRIVSVSGGVVQEYAAQVYVNPLEIVFKDGKLYYLDRVLLSVGTDPFSSIDFAAELAEGKWKVINHSHANLDVLDALSVVDGKLAYNGVAVDTINREGVGVFSPVADLAALKAIDTTDAAIWPDKWLIHAETIGIYALDRESIETADDDTVIAPTTGAGRWIKKNVRGPSGKIRHDTYTALTLSGTMSWDVNNLAEGKATLTFPSGTAVTDVAFSLSNAASGFTGILAVYNNDSVSHNINLPTASNYAVSDGESASMAIAAGEIAEFNFAHDGTKIKVTKGAFVAI
jgi:hypothetical protein